MKLKSKATDAVDLLFHQDGVPAKMIMVGWQEHTLGQILKKFQQASVHIKQTEPYSPWQNAAKASLGRLY